MTAGSSGAFGGKKIDYLKQCIRITEDLLSNDTDDEKIRELIQRRGDVILLLAKLEREHKGVPPTASEISTADQLIDLLLKLNIQAVQKIKKEQQDILDAMKVNIKEQKLTAYNASAAPTEGRLLDKTR
jgi:hypothetical protein